MQADEYLHTIVEPNLRKYLNDPTNRQHAWNATVSANQIRDYYFIRTAGRALTGPEKDSLTEKLLTNVPTLASLNKIANAFKHVIAARRQTPLTAYTSAGAMFQAGRKPTSQGNRFLQIFWTPPDELYIKVDNTIVSVETTVKDAVTYWQRRLG
jgi:hypothetical protein